MEKIKVRNNIQLECEFFGQENEPLVVLISGAGAPAEFWPAFFCEGLADRGFRVLRYSHRDTGLSTHFDDPYPVYELLDDLVSLVVATEKNRVSLVGHSMGGFLSQMAVCFSSLSIKSAVSISAGSAVEPALCAELGMSMPSEATWKILMQNQPAGDFENDLKAWLFSWEFLNGILSFDRELAIAYTKSLYRGDSRNSQVATNHIHAMSTIPVELVGELRKTKCPVLVIHGTDDVLVPYDNGEITARLVPDSKFAGLEGAGHMYFNKPIWMKILDHITNHLIQFSWH